jgi:acid stress-induced BolA-like protein IbaG/YrbA
MVRKVKRLLKEAFPDPDRVQVRDEDGVIGIVTSERFNGLDVIDRQNMIWAAIEKGLTVDEKRRVLTIVAVTPREELAHTS